MRVRVAQEALQAAQVQLDNTIVRAPFAGVVTVKAAQPGEMISPISAGGGSIRTGIGTIVDMDSLEIQVDVSEAYINRVQPGQKVEAVLNAYPDWRIPASVIAIVPTADRSKATVKVRIALGEKDARIVPEMGVRVAFLESQPEGGSAACGAARRAGSSCVRCGRMPARTWCSCCGTAGPSGARSRSAAAWATAARCWPACPREMRSSWMRRQGLKDGDAVAARETGR